MNKKAAFITLGCKLNFAETSTFARQFAAEGWDEVKPGPGVDVVVINTCSVTEHADKKCRNLIRRLHKVAPEARIAITGCYAQLKPQEILEIDGVDLVVGTERKGELVPLVLSLFKAGNGDAPSRQQGYSCDVDAVDSFFPAYASGERTRSFLKVQDGCDYHCAYCTVPLARGRSRNLPVADLVAQAREIAAQQRDKTLAEMDYLEGMLLDVDKCVGESELEEIRQELVRTGYMKKTTSRRQQRQLPQSRPYRYQSDDGIEILVGKNAAQNDRITLGAKPEELWLHAKDMPGSHVIICREGEIPQTTMKQAALLAAWYSKGQRSSMVPVDYTLRKYVKKPSGAAPGRVIYTHQKTVYVTAEEEEIRSIPEIKDP